MRFRATQKTTHFGSFFDRCSLILNGNFFAGLGRLVDGIRNAHKGRAVVGGGNVLLLAVIAAKTWDMEYTAPAVNRLKNKKSDNTKNYKGNACNLRLSGLTWQGYDFLREHPRFRAVVRLLAENREQ